MDPADVHGAVRPSKLRNKCRFNRDHFIPDQRTLTTAEAVLEVPGHFRRLEFCRIYIDGEACPPW
jgi:hypothetical protein